MGRLRACRPQLETAGWLTALLVTGLMLGLGCAGVIGIQAPRFEYFAAPDPDDAWSPKIAGWQRRERLDEGAGLAGEDGRRPVAADGPAVSPGAAGEAVVDPKASPPAAPSDAQEPGSRLRDEYFSFRAERKRELARSFASWIQTQARDHYVADGPIDHWATLEETLRADGDDCDGLELLTFHGLRDLGFDDHEVYRSIVYRPSDGQLHMVTLWFEDPGDPWVIDPTGAMTRGMPRMSDLPEWVPLKLFGEREEYTVRPGGSGEDATRIASRPPR